MKENNSTTKNIVTALGSATSFFGTIYGIVLVLSLSYNIGYFKQINPQIVDLMEIIDYINETIHNMWFFLLGALLFFSSSLAFVTTRIGGHFYKTLVIGTFAFIVSGYFLLKGIYYSKFWPLIRQSLGGSLSTSTIIIVSLLFAIFMVLVLIYKISIKVMDKSKSINNDFIGITPIIIFLLLVLMPYIGGITQGYIENKYLTKEDYDKIHSVDIELVFNNEAFKNVYIIKLLNKGLIIRQFKEISKDKFIFLPWPSIKAITYKEVEAENFSRFNKS
jgi:hypothetical protein